MIDILSLNQQDLISHFKNFITDLNMLITSDSSNEQIANLIIFYGLEKFHN